MRQVTLIYVVLHFHAKVLGNVNGIFSGKGDGKNFHKLVVILVTFLGWLATKLFFPVLLVTAFRFSGMVISIIPSSKAGVK